METARHVFAAETVWSARVGAVRSVRAAIRHSPHRPDRIAGAQDDSHIQYLRCRTGLVPGKKIILCLHILINCFIHA
jgi:hypothetical protein